MSIKPDMGRTKSFPACYFSIAMPLQFKDLFSEIQFLWPSNKDPCGFQCQLIYVFLFWCQLTQSCGVLSDFALGLLYRSGLSLHLRTIQNLSLPCDKFVQKVIPQVKKLSAMAFKDLYVSQVPKNAIAAHQVLALAFTWDYEAFSSTLQLLL